MTADPYRVAAAAILVIGWVVWTILRSRASKGWSGRTGKPNSSADAAYAPLGETIVAYASQTGVAAGLAERTAQALAAGGLAARAERLGDLGTEAFARASRVLFVVSTCGEGDAPDDAWNFVRQMAQAGRDEQALRLDGLEFAMLALGDSGYRNFCAFGKRLDAWLRARGARPLTERIEVDGDDERALRRWSDAIERLARDYGTATSAAASPDIRMTGPEFHAWKLTAREIANHGSRAPSVLRLRFEPVSVPLTEAAWQPGDLARLRVPGEPACTRDYSIASLPSDACIELLVRLRFDERGWPGRATAWLSGRAELSARPVTGARAGASLLEPGGVVELARVPNPGFRLAAAADQPLILIAAGSGLAGVLGLLRARAAAGAGPNWLLFGERESAHDFLCRDEIEAWQRRGTVERLDAVFSRDDPTHPYVQNRLVEQADRLRQWVGAGAFIHVCGSRERLAAGVEAALAGILGVEGFQDLRTAGRYRRDVW
jgi:sulfite reductase (NADPH) flavoprotein alpha-component